MTSVIVLIALSAVLQQPQEPSEARTKLVRALEDRLEALGPLSAEVRLEKVDSKGAKTVTQACRLHLRSDEASHYFAAKNLEADGRGEEFFTFSLMGEFTLMWSREGEGILGVNPGGHRRIFGRDLPIRSVAHALYGTSPKHKDVDAMLAAARPMVTLDIAPDPEEKGKYQFNFSIGISESSRASWLQEVLNAPDAALTEKPDGVTVAFPSYRKTLVVDPASGFLRSVRIDEEGGGARLLTVANLERNAPRPDVRLPAKFETKRLAAPDAPAGRHAASLFDSVPAFRDRLVREWAVAGSEEKAEALRAYVALIAADYEASKRECGHRKLVVKLLQSLRDKGHGPNEVSKGLAEVVPSLKAVIEKGEAEERETIAGFTAELKGRMLACAREAPAGVAATLSERIKEGFEPDRMAKARATRPPPDAADLLRQEIADEIELAEAPARLATNHRAWQARRLQELVAKSGPVSFTLVTESSESGEPDATSSEIDLHFRGEDSFAFAAIYKIQEGRRKLFQNAVYGFDGKVLTWEPGEVGNRVDLGPGLEAVWSLAWDRELELARLQERPPSHATKEAWRASFRPFYVLRFTPAAAKGPIYSNISAGALLHPDGGATWVDDFRSARSIDLSEADVARIGGEGWSALIDLKTGFPRSFRNDFKEGKFKVVKVTDLKIGSPKPDIPLPDRIRESVTPPEFKAKDGSGWLWETLTREIPRMLREWERFGEPSRSDAIRRFFSGAAAWNREFFRDAVRMDTAINLVRNLVKAGKGLDDLEKSLDAETAEFVRRMDKFERENADRFSESDRAYKSRLVAFISRVGAPFESRRALAQLVNQAFEPERIDKAKPDRPPTDYKRLLQSAIDDARRKEVK